MSVTSQNPWVNFDDPPVTEVVVAVAFRPIPGLSLAHLGVFWDEYLSERYPDLTEQPPYDPPIERFDGPSSTGLSLTFSDAPPWPRLWCTSPDGQELVQLQRNWLACNWRKVRPDADYSRWEPRRDAFEHHLTNWLTFVKSRGLGEITPVQCEVTYVNHIYPTDAWAHHGQLSRVLSVVEQSSGPFLPEPEEVRFRSQYVIEVDGQRRGRLHVTVDPVVNRKDASRAFLMNLTARGEPSGDGVDEMLAFMDVGREWITRSFKELTTPDMHKAWGLKDG